MLDELSRRAGGPRALAVPHTGTPEDDGSEALYGLRPGRMREQLAAATTAGKLAERLLAAPRDERLARIAADPAYRRDSLALLLALAAEERLEAAPPAAEEHAEAAFAVAIALPPASATDVRHLQAISAWLLAKAQLALGRLDAAESTFRRARQAAAGAGARERALVTAGLAQLRWQQRLPEEALVLLTAAAWEYANLHDRDAVAACRAQAGFLLLGAGDLALARITLRAAHRDLGRAAAPSLAVLIALGIAHCEISLRGTAAADFLALARDSAARARPAPGKLLGRWWDAVLDLPPARPPRPQATSPEAPRQLLSIADDQPPHPLAVGATLPRPLAAKGDEPSHPLAGAADVPRQPLAGADLGRALRSTLDQAMSRIAAGRGNSVTGLAAALAAASPEQGRLWGEEIAALATMAALRPDDYPAAARDLALRLAARDIAGLAAGRLPWGLCQLADRLLRQRREREDPIGAAGR
jgi:hypothetical protein